MDNSPRRMHAPLERQRSENNHIRDGRWPLRIGALTAAVALILVLMFNFVSQGPAGCAQCHWSDWNAFVLTVALTFALTVSRDTARAFRRAAAG